MIIEISETLIAGVATLLIGLSIHFLFGYHAKHANSPTMTQEMTDLSVILFFTGIILYIFFKLIGTIEVYKKTRVD
jgi:hypothetical protein